MQKYEIIQNESNIKSKEILFKDVFLNRITDILIEHSEIMEIHKFIHDLFYLKDIEEYDFALTRNLIGYETHYELFIEIFNLFREYKPYEKYNLGLLRGTFLELLSYKYLRQVYNDTIIYKESKIKLENYESHTWDLIIDLKEYLNLYECKFSTEFIKEAMLIK